MPSKTRTSKRRGKTTRRRGRAKAKTIAGNPFLALLAEIKTDVDARLHGYLDAKVDEASRHGKEVVELVEAVRDLCLRGGKRLRPGLAVVGYRAANTRARLEPVLDAGIALELLQAYFLIHDDWMDHDTVRRGGPAVHALLGARFRSREVGDAAGILAGDYAAALATEALARVDIPASRMARVFATFATMQTAAIAGQQLDLLGRAGDVEKTYELKTGSYSVRGPLRLGAVLGGASPKVLTALDRYSVPVGVAFQLRDDLLSAFGEPDKTGKPLGSDLKSGKRTLLLAHAMKRARGRDHRVLSAVVGNAKASDAQVRRAVQVLEKTGAHEAMQLRIDELVSEAIAAVQPGSGITKQGVDLLHGAAHALTRRTS